LLYVFNYQEHKSDEISRYEDNSFTKRFEEEADGQSNETTPSTPISNQKLDLNEKNDQMPNNEINMYVYINQNLNKKIKYIQYNKTQRYFGSDKIIWDINITFYEYNACDILQKRFYYNMLFYILLLLMRVNLNFDE